MWRVIIFIVLFLSLASAALAESSDESAPDNPQMAEDLRDLTGHNPVSIIEESIQDDAKKEYFFQLPGVDNVLNPWYDFKEDLSAEHGLNIGFSFMHLYQWASDSVGPEDDASGFEFAFDGTWTFLGRGTDSPTIAGFQFIYKDRLGTELAPLPLFTQLGTLYPTAAALQKTDPALAQFWIQQQFENRWGFRLGKLFPIGAYDYFPLKNFRTDFIDALNAANLAIPLPDYGLGGFVMYRPQPNIYCRAGFHDANADVEKSGFDTLFDEGELFKILELGFYPGIKERQPGRPPLGDVHVSFWHQDERDKANVDDGWGFVVSGSQWYGRYLPFLRYGYAEDVTRGPALAEHMINGGVAIDNIFGRENDRIGIGLTWSRPTNKALDDQGQVDMYYRIQVTPEIAVSPTLQFVIDPVRNPDEDEIFILGIRTRIDI
jgi:porin